MGPEQLAGVMELLQRQTAAKAGIEFDEENAVQIREYMMQQVKQSSSAWYATAQGWDDGIIDPRDTRIVLSICLMVVNNVPIKGTEAYGLFRM